VLRIRPRLNARSQVESILKWVFFACAALAILTTVGIIFSVAFETFRFFGKVPFTEFIFGSHWSPQTALRADQVASQGAFGMIPLFTGTLLISAIAMVVAVPVGLLSAIYLSEYAGRKVRGVVKPLLEMLGGIPTVVYGLLGRAYGGAVHQRSGRIYGYRGIKPECTGCRCCYGHHDHSVCVFPVG